ncbi:MAG TPA: 2-dehydropantoate 2-reductase [Spirochaetota bacterium]|nr:2-dehydropantoate 2-reductase [Spirochaetota bacterium]
MNITIVGPGAVGLLLAGYLHRGGAAVTLADELAERADLLNREGIRWEGLDADFRFTVPVTLGLKDVAGTDLVILCVKAYHTETASRQIHDAGYSGPIMTLQNGVGNAEMIIDMCPGSPVIAGITSEGANLAADNHVRHAGKGKTIFGPVVPGMPDSGFMKELVTLMKKAGLDAELSADPQALVWGKVLVNAGINALTAILQVRNGQLLEIETARDLMKDLVLEACEVIARKGVALSEADPVARVEEVCRRTAANYSSMCMDIKHGRRTEIDFINGAIVREGRARGMACPYNDAVTKMVKGLEVKMIME